MVRGLSRHSVPLLETPLPPEGHNENAPITHSEALQRLNGYQPRSYQLPIAKALSEGFKRILAILPRRAGKDVTALNLMIRQMYLNPGVYYYIFPTYSQAKKVIWDSMTNTGEKMLDYFPKDLVTHINASEMKIRLRNVNGTESLFQLIGSDNYDSLMGTNPRGCVFSEYALQNPMAYQYLRPILTANDGWALFIGTPRGKNHLWALAEVARNSPDWFFLSKTVEDTQHIPLSEIEKERQEGLMSEDMIQQEYYCSFDMGVEGAYYAKYLDELRRSGRIGEVPWESGHLVHTAWDIGVRDATAIVFYQQIGATVRVVDCYHGEKMGLEHYVGVINSKPYAYGSHVAPHDIRVREWGTGMTRWEKARDLGINFTICPNLHLSDGIEAVRTVFSKTFIDSKACSPLLKSLENYRQQYDHKRKCYAAVPLHDWSSHYADAFRYMTVGLPLTGASLSAQELDKIRHEAWEEPLLPAPFRVPNLEHNSHTW